jgi:hypothetical protein
MKRQDFEHLYSLQQSDVMIGGSRLINCTLLYGYTVDRETIHVYQKDLEIHHLRYSGYTDQEEILLHEYGEELPASKLLINHKKFYPESCDFLFVNKIRMIGFMPSLTTFSDERYEKVKHRVFHGKTIEDFIAAPKP